MKHHEDGAGRRGGAAGAKEGAPFFQFSLVCV